MGQMDEHMKKMQALHDRMMSATTPEERRSVMDEQRREMQAGMAMMNQMQGRGMKGAMDAGMMDQKGKPADANAQMQMMQKRMDMMQMMMQTMMDQQGMMSSPRERAHEVARLQLRRRKMATGNHFALESPLARPWG